MVAPTLTVEQYQYADDGVLLNGNPPVPFFDVTSIQGLDNAPVKSQQVDREGTDGGYVDAEYEGVRTVTIEGTIYASVTNMETYLDLLKVNFAPSRLSRPFYFQTDAGLRTVYGKSLGLSYSKDTLRRTGRANAQIQIMCEDPVIYVPTIVSVNVSLSSTPVAGRSYPKSYAFGYGAVATENALVITMSGNRDTAGILRIDGSITNPSIVNDTTGTTMAFNQVLSSGEYITVDLNTKAVLKNGITSVRSSMTLTGRWFKLSPGVNSFRLLGTQAPPTPAGKLTVSGYPAYR